MNGLILKIPNKGYISVCDNLRGISLISIPSKLFCHVNLNRIRMDQKIREEQTGFRAGRGISDHIFVLRNIFQQCIDRKAPLFVNLVDSRRLSIVSFFMIFSIINQFICFLSKQLNNCFQYQNYFLSKLNILYKNLSKFSKFDTV